MGSVLMSKLERLQEEIFKRRPILKALLADVGDMPLMEYAAKLFTHKGKISESAVEVISKRLKGSFSNEISEQVISELREHGTFLTADHHGALFHPVLFQGDYLMAEGAKRAGFKNGCVMAVGMVPLNHPTYPRGVFWQGQKIPLFPDRMKHHLVYGCPAADRKSFEKLPPPLRDIALEAEIFDCAFFSEQVTRLNYALWSAAFRGSLPSLIYFQAEDITVELLKLSIKERDEIFEMLCDGKVRDKTLVEFSGINGCWDGERGSHFFLARNESGEGLALRVKGDTLCGEDVSVEMDGEALLEALEKKVLVPGLFLTYTVLLKHGFRCIGGFTQVDALSAIKEGLGRLLNNKTNEAIDTKGYVTGLLYLFDSIYNPLSLDRFLEHRSIETALKEKLTVKEANLLGLPLQYSNIVSKSERIPELEELTVSEIAKTIL